MMSQERLTVAYSKGDVEQLESVKKALVELSEYWKKYSQLETLKQQSYNLITQNNQRSFFSRM